MPGGASRPAVEGLTLTDVLDQRAYERVRDRYRAQIIELKRRRRIPLGPIMTVVFENVDTVCFQVHEMARAERISTDEGIQAELDVYNRLLPRVGELSATLFIELTTPEDLRRWLPALVGVERSLAFELAATPGSEATILVRGLPEAEHAAALTREAVTAAVHYVRFAFTDAEVAAFGAGQVALTVRHGSYEARTDLSEPTRLELLGDLTGRGVPIPLG
jgi:xanthine/CO dehydrogenase XdhC/CoxF family maturation factor